MGREIRRVPPDWQHPRERCKHSPWMGGCDDAKAHGGECYRPLCKKSFREAVAEWKTGYARWESGENPDRAENPDMEFWEWHGDPPDREFYRPDWPEGTATAFQVYETVSEGTPVSPVFATLAEMEAWLVEQGHSPAAAAAFVKDGWAPSMVVHTGGLNAGVHVGIDALGLPRDV